MAAKDTVLGQLHEKLAAAYLKALDNPEEMTPALLSSITKFLKDNGIVAEVGDEEMDELAQAAQEATNMPFTVVQNG